MLLGLFASFLFLVRNIFLFRSEISFDRELFKLKCESESLSLRILFFFFFFFFALLSFEDVLLIFC